MRKSTEPCIKLCMISAIPGTLWGFYGDLIDQLKALSVDITIVSSDEPLLKDFKNQRHCKILPMEIARQITPLTDIISIYKLSRHFRREKYDIIHAHIPKGGLIGMASAFLGGATVRIYTMHGLLLETSTGLKRKLLWLIEYLTCKLATTILVVSPSVKRRAIEEKLCSADKLKILGDGTACGVNLTRFKISEETHSLRRETREKLTIPEDATVIGFVGRLVPDKGIEILIDSFVKLQQQTDNIYLLLVGRVETIRDCLNQQTMEIIKSNSNILCTGHVADTVPFYVSMDIIVLPSKREGFPYVPLEAAALGLPVIATKVTGCVDAVVNNVTGLLVEVDNVEQLTEAILTLVQEPELRQKFCERGYDRVVKLFDSNRLIAEHIALYERILGKKIGALS